ncbi:MaoC/PaaZ C-terminal domain-containing protein [Mucilaginibacter sp. UYCu711]|uniref:MaoC/PaaZ C-terminal domain-containing protein n=1 Tax=Mucilaginibacter sp. UYCu711 TaxID=3156339 RepID=UPI003D1FD30A
MIFKSGDTFEQTFIVTEQIYLDFINTFGDKNPLHSSDEFAKQHGFNSCVMHGNILNGFVSFFIGECLPCKNVIIHAQNIDFKNPVYMNDNLVFKATVVEVFESVNAVEFKFSFQNPALKTVAKGKIQIGILL